VIDNYSKLDSLRNGVIVSCQAGPESPLNTPTIIAALAKSAELGGAIGFRVDGADNIVAVRAVSSLPILGINKSMHPGFDVFITPTLESATAIATAGADMIAIDGTQRPRPKGERFQDIVAAIHAEYHLPMLADIATAAEAFTALEHGADAVLTTLAGYTTYSTDRAEPAFDVLKEVTDRGGRVIVEGRIWTPEHVSLAFELGAFAVVIGSAITVPEFITRRFVAATKPAALIA
jgi:N-acylglucosamine-6-phosphate 2-epimerase